mmetsp:Transcript_87998/g.201038  ORF Transcript_87998/g.201038 Transcript_87998/m.201038 type:complete len:202 (-) Transcript_87998:423-1028(-)
MSSVWISRRTTSLPPRLGRYLLRWPSCVGPCLSLLPRWPRGLDERTTPTPGGIARATTEAREARGMARVAGKGIGRILPFKRIGMGRGIGARAEAIGARAIGRWARGTGGRRRWHRAEASSGTPRFWAPRAGLRTNGVVVSGAESRPGQAGEGQAPRSPARWAPPWEFLPIPTKLSQCTHHHADTAGRQRTTRGIRTVSHP